MTLETDARDDFPEIVPETEPVTFQVRDAVTGEVGEADEFQIIHLPDGSVFNSRAAPPLTPEQVAEYSQDLREMLEYTELNYPRTAKALLNNPESLFLFSEIKFALDPSAQKSVWDLTIDLHDALFDEVAAPGVQKLYTDQTMLEPTQEIFWHEIGNKYEQVFRDFLIMQMAQLDPKGADWVASRALAWVEEHGLDSSENKDQLLGLMTIWQFRRKQWELGNVGLFEKLDAPENWKDDVFSSAMDWAINLFGSPEDAARRHGLTFGEQIMYQMGVRPSYEMETSKLLGLIPVPGGMWELGSGAIDAMGEILFDPLNILAAPFVAGKAIKEIPLAAKAIKAGRLKTAGKAMLPRFFAGPTRQIGGGRTSRVLYSFMARSYDELIESMAKTGVADDVMNLVRSNKMGLLRRRYPALANMSELQLALINSPEYAKDAEDVVQIIRAGALNDVLFHQDDLLKVENDLAQAKHVLFEGRKLTPQEIKAVETAYAQLKTSPQMFGRVKTAIADLLRGVKPGGLEESARAIIRDFSYFADQAPGMGRVLRRDEVTALRKTGVEGVHDIILETVESGATRKATEEGKWVAIFEGEAPIRVVGEGNKREFYTSGRYVVEHIDDETKSIFLRHQDDLITRASADNILGAAGHDKGLLMDVIHKQLRYNALTANPQKAFIIWDVPSKVKKVVAWNNVLRNIKGRSTLATATRRIIARATPGKPADEISLFNDRKAYEEIQNLMEHFGVRQDAIDKVLEELPNISLGARQDWFWNTVIHTIGEEIGVGVLTHDLLTMYRKSGYRRYASSGVDHYIDEAGRHPMPILPSHMNQKMPVPVAEMTQIAHRAGFNRKAVKLRGRATVDPRGKHNKRRLELAEGFQKLVKKEHGIDLSLDEAWDMAYSYVSPEALTDGRGWFAARALPEAQTLFGWLQTFFTKAMLLTRPIQWVWRVAILEEPIRAHLFNMPSMYRNPLEWGAAAKEAHYLAHLKGWRLKNLKWAETTFEDLAGVGIPLKAVLNRIDDAGLTEAIFGKIKPKTLTDARKQILNFLEDSVYGRTRLNRLDPIKKASWAVRRKARKIHTAEEALAKNHLKLSFNLVDDVPDIHGKVMKGYLGDAAGVSSRVEAYHWDDVRSEKEAFAHGYAYTGRITQMLEDRYGRIAFRRVLARHRGKSFSPDIGERAIVSHPYWDLMKPDLSKKFPKAGNDLELARLYMDEVLEVEIKHLLQVFSQNMNKRQYDEFLNSLISNRRMKGSLFGEAFDINISGGRHGDGVREFGEFARKMRGESQFSLPDVYAPSLDPRFMSGQHNRKKIRDRILQFFGDTASQALNRRPAWVREYKRWFENYRAIGVPEDVAASLANDHAAQMVNYVFFNMDEAPYLAEKLNKYIPFFGATYEVLSAWTYKMPVAVGGVWPVGAAEMARKFQRLMDAFVNMGLVTREMDEEGNVSHMLHLLPPDHESYSTEAASMLNGAGYHIVNTLENVVSTVFGWMFGGLDEGKKLRDQGYRLSLGHPLNFGDYGVLSYAQFHAGLNPAVNFVISRIAALVPGAGDDRRTVTEEGGENLAELSERLGYDMKEIVRLNRDAIVNLIGYEDYNRLLADTMYAEDVDLPSGLPIRLPDSRLWSVLEDIFFPFGQVDEFDEFGINFLGGGLRWMVNGMALAGQPTDEFWKGDYGEGLLGGMIPTVNEAQISAQLSEAFMYLEAHDLVKVGDEMLGPFARLQLRYEEYQGFIDAGKHEEADVLLANIKIDESEWLGRIQRIAAESLILRSLTGQMLPTSPGHVREEWNIINDFWASREYADSILARSGAAEVQMFRSLEEIEQFMASIGAWMKDGTGDEARALFRKNHPQLMAYLTPKTFYAREGIPPEITSYEDYVKQIESGERQAAPLHITVFRAKSAAIQADYLNKYISQFGTDPYQAAANALRNRGAYNELQDEKNLAYQALYMWDDMHGGLYENWQQERSQDDSFSLDLIVENLNAVRDYLGLALELEDAFEYEIGLDDIPHLNQSLKAAIAKISDGIDAYRDLQDEEGFRNPYEEAMHRWFEEVYNPYQEGLTALFDKLEERPDSERQSLIFEQVKLYRNEYANQNYFLDGNAIVPFPSPLEYQWAGRDEEEREEKRQLWLSRPLEWMDQDQALRIVEANPLMAALLPVSDEDFEIYRNYTLARITIDEKLEVNEITPHEATKMRKELKAQLRTDLITSDRGGEVLFMDLTPYEKLEVGNSLPPSLGIFGNYVRYYKDVLASHGITAGSTPARKILQEFYDFVKKEAANNPDLLEALIDVGGVIMDKATLDNILPYLFFGVRSEL